MRFVRQAKEFGFSLEEIREILKMRDRGECPFGDVIAIAEKHLQLDAVPDPKSSLKPEILKAQLGKDLLLTGTIPALELER